MSAVVQGEGRGHERLEVASRAGGRDDGYIAGRIDPTISDLPLLPDPGLPLQALGARFGVELVAVLLRRLVHLVVRSPLAHGRDHRRVVLVLVRALVAR